MQPLLLTLLFGAGVAAAQAEPSPHAPVDPFSAPACVQARADLDAARVALTAPATTTAQSQQLKQARRAVARICLGEAAARERTPGPSRERTPGRMAQAPLSVVTPAAPPASEAGSQPAPPTAGWPGPASPNPPPPVLTACDASGCWHSNGRRLERAGPLLLGPDGPCTAPAELLNCR